MLHDNGTADLHPAGLGTAPVGRVVDRAPEVARHVVYERLVDAQLQEHKPKTVSETKNNSRARAAEPQHTGNQ